MISSRTLRAEDSLLSVSLARLSLALDLTLSQPRTSQDHRRVRNHHALGVLEDAIAASKDRASFEADITRRTTSLNFARRLARRRAFGRSHSFLKFYPSSPLHTRFRSDRDEDSVIRVKRS